MVERDCAIIKRSEQGESTRAKRVRVPSWRGFGHGSAGTVGGKLRSGPTDRSSAVDGEDGRAEQVLKRPAAGEVKASTAGAEFDELRRPLNCSPAGESPA